MISYTIEEEGLKIALGFEFTSNYVFKYEWSHSGFNHVYLGKSALS